MSVARSYIRGPRFALRSTDPGKVRACINCVYGNGPHAPWCEKRPTIVDYLCQEIERAQGLGSFADPPEFQGEPITPENVNTVATLDGIAERVYPPPRCLWPHHPLGCKCNWENPHVRNAD